MNREVETSTAHFFISPENATVYIHKQKFDLVGLIGWVGKFAEGGPTKPEEKEEPGGGRRHHSHPHVILSLFAICETEMGSSFVRNWIRRKRMVSPKHQSPAERRGERKR